MSHHINFTDFWPPPLLSSFPFLPFPSLNCMLSLLFNIGPWSYLNVLNVTEMYQFTSKFVNIHMVCKLQFYNGSGNWVHSDVSYMFLCWGVFLRFLCLIKSSVVNKVFHALPSLKTTLHTPYLQRCNVLRHSEPKDLENLDLITLHL